MTNLFDLWCHKSEALNGRKKLWRMTELEGGREAVKAKLAARTSNHYASDEEVADWIEVLGYATAATCLREQFPAGPTGRSADLGEILASELIEEQLGYVVPVKKLRDKDHREVAMRGEDVIGVAYDEEERLLLLKGEAKSAQALSKKTVEEARAGLERHAGRPTPHSLIFLGRRLLQSENEDENEMGADIMREAANRAIPKSQIAHYMFTMSGNPATNAIDDDFAAADGGRDQYAVNLRIPDHGDFVSTIYNEVVNLANR